MKSSDTTLRRGAIALLAGMAAFPAAQAAIPTVGATFYVSGASAAREVPKAIASEFCDTAVNDRADYVYGPKPKDYTITICTYKTTTDVPSSLRGVKVAIFTRAAGGSLFGVKPVAVPQTIKFIDGATCPADDGNPAITQSCPDLLAADYGAPNTGRIPDVGISDEDGKFVCNVAKEVGPVQCSATELTGIANTAKYKAAPTYQTVWTIQASSKFGDTTKTAAKVTDITPTVLNGIFSGSYVSLAQVKQAMGVATVPADATRGLKVCRRTNTSGTQAGQTQLWVGASYCGATDSYGFVSAASDDDNAGNGFPLDYTVVEASSSGDLETCLTAAGDEDRAIGINSLENNAPVGAFAMSINGVPASQQNAAQGTYPWYSESTAQYNTDTQSGAAAVVAQDSTLVTSGGRSTVTQRQQFATLFVNSLKSPAKLYNGGLTGVLAIPGGSNVPDATWNATNPVGWTKKNGANCRAPQPVFPTP